MIWWITGGIAAIALALIIWGVRAGKGGGAYGDEGDWLLVIYGIVLLVVAGVVLLGWWLLRLILG